MNEPLLDWAKKELLHLESTIEHKSDKNNIDYISGKISALRSFVNKWEVGQLAVIQLIVGDDTDRMWYNLGVVDVTKEVFVKISIQYDKKL